MIYIRKTAARKIHLFHLSDNPFQAVQIILNIPPASCDKRIDTAVRTAAYDLLQHLPRLLVKMARKIRHE